MSFSTRFEHLFQINFHKFIQDKDAVSLFQTCKTTYYHIYPNYKFTARYSVEVFLALMNNEKPALGNNSFNPTLTYLIDKGIGDSGATFLAKTLEVNRSVTEINLKFNGIEDSGAFSLSKALEVNKNVKIIRNAIVPYEP